MKYILFIKTKIGNIIKINRVFNLGFLGIRIFHTGFRIGLYKYEIDIFTDYIRNNKIVWELVEMKIKNEKMIKEQRNRFISKIKNKISINN